MSLIVTQSNAESSLDPILSVCMPGKTSQTYTNLGLNASFYFGLFRICVGAKMGHKVEVVMGSCECLGVRTTGLLITVSL